MAKYASKVVAQAQAWLGRKEGSSGHKAIVDIYNAHKPLARGYKVKYTDAWCATFVSSVAIKLGYTDIIPTECGCGKMIELFKKLGSWVENENRTPNPGDIIFYDFDDNGKGDNLGAPEHVGIVEKVSNGQITVIEGNHDGTDADRIDGVERRQIAVNGKYIRGYGVPKYDAELIKEEGGEKMAEKTYHYWTELPEWAYAPVKALYDAGFFRGASPADLNLSQTKMECLVIMARAFRKAGWINYEE